MAHWFGVRPWEIDLLTGAEIEELLSRLSKCPPIGGQVQYQLRK